MRIYLSSVLVLAHLCLFLPITSAAPDGSGTHASVQGAHEVAEDSRVKIESPASFLSPSYILEGIQNAYLPSALRVTSAFEAFIAREQSSSDFWEMAKKYEKKLQDYIPRLLDDAATYFKNAKFTDIASNMHHIVNATATFRDNIKGALDAHHITFDALTEELEDMFMMIVNDLEKIPSPDKAPSHAERADMVEKVLDDTTLALVNLATRYGIEEEVVMNYLNALKPHVQALIVLVGDINEQHPELLPALAFSVAALLIPESWILRPFLSMFGFGPEGPIKGSVAAWMQRRFWGAAVKPGSWFSLLQKAGMGVYPKWAWLVSRVPFLGGALLGFFPCSPCFRRR